MLAARANLPMSRTPSTASTTSLPGRAIAWNTSLLLLWCLGVSPAQEPTQPAPDVVSERPVPRVGGVQIVLERSLTLADLGISRVFAVAFDGTGKHLCIGSRDQLAVITLTDGKHQTYDLLGARLVGTSTGGIFLWRNNLVYDVGAEAPTAAGSELARVSSKVPMVATDGATLVDRGTFAELVLLRDGAWQRIRLPHPSARTAAFDPEQQRCAVASSLVDSFGGSFDLGITIFDAAGAITASIPRQPSQAPRTQAPQSIHQLAFSLDGQLLYACGTTTRCFDVATGTLRAQTDRFQSFLQCIDPQLAIGHDEDLFTFWDAGSLRAVKSIPIAPRLEVQATAPNEIRSRTTLSPERDRLALAAGEQVRIYRLQR